MALAANLVTASSPTMSHLTKTWSHVIPRKEHFLGNSSLNFRLHGSSGLCHLPYMSVSSYVDDHGRPPASASSKVVACLSSSSSSSSSSAQSASSTPTRLYISGLSFRTTKESLQNAFEKFGSLVEVKLVMDKIANRPKGFAFLSYATEEESKQAIEGMHGKFLDGRVIFVEVARPRSETPKNKRNPGELLR